MNIKDDYTWLCILVCIGLMFVVLVWAGLTDPELEARRNGTWEPPSGSSYNQSEGWHFNRLNGQLNPGLWTDAQHAIIFDN